MTHKESSSYIKYINMTQNKQHISIVVAGHVDAGKSSLTGRLLFDLGGINEREMKKLQEEAVATSCKKLDNF